MITGARILVLAALALLLGAHPAMGNGVDLPKRKGSPGERIETSGHDWLTCCPSGTPVEHVELFLLAGADRIRLFDVPADDRGEIRAAFEVPSLPPGTYPLEACRRGPALPGVAPGATCIPEGDFRIVEAVEGGGSPVGLWLAIGIGVAASVAVAAGLVRRRSRAPSRLQ